MVSGPLTSNLLFKATIFSDHLLAVLGGDFSKVFLGSFFYTYLFI
jgi:hypothetical protein